MRLVLCWSGERSYQLAIALRGWLPKVLSSVQPFISSDIPKGSVWFEAIITALDKAEGGLICLTPENLNSKWIHFEAGALARSFETSKIYTYLYGVKPGELTGPLGAFQSTESTQVDTRNLIRSIANSMEMSTPRDTEWQLSFDSNWHDLEKMLQELDTLSIKYLLPRLEELFQRKTFTEPLDECSQGNWIDRYYGARQTFDKLKQSIQSMNDKTPAYLKDIYKELMSQTDQYAMHMRAFLLEEKKFPPGPDGHLQIPEGMLLLCEARRQRIKQLVAELTTRQAAPP